MSILSWLKARYRWNFVGAVKAETFLIDDNGNRKAGQNLTCYYLLHERGDGKRKFDKVGNFGGSQAAYHAKAKVQAWMAGGALPQLEEDFQQSRKQPAKLFAINGGKEV